MKAELESLIRSFRDAQDIAVSTIVNVLKMPLPSSGLNWLRYCCDNGVQLQREWNGVPIHAHGYGIELKIDGLSIDFDWGPNGEPDTFDAWRLYYFSRSNVTGISCTHEEVIQWIDDAHRQGELDRIGYMYVDPKRRASD